MQADTSWTRRLNGTIKAQRIELPQAEPREFFEQFTSRLRFVWEPPYQISRLPNWFKLALDCYVEANGTRRFTLVELGGSELAAAELGLPEISTARGLSLVASVGGYALMLDRGTVERDLLLTHDEARLFVRYIEHRQEFLGTRKSLDKVIHRPEDGKANERGHRKKATLAFAENLGRHASGDGHQWTISRFNEEALSAAHAAGLESPTAHQLFSHGLTAAAKLNPLYMDSVSQVEAIVRLAFFALPGSSKEVTYKELQYAATQLRASLRDHLEDSDEEFENWIDDPKSNLLRRLTRRRDCPMSRDQLKRVLVELGWHSLQMLGRCIDVQMRAFRDALPDPLTNSEDYYFSQIFLAHPALGGLPLVLLHNRYDDLSAAFVHVWNNPGNRDAIAVLHRAMAYYAEFMANRREADKIYKRRSLARNAQDHIATEQELDDKTCLPLASTEEKLFLEIAKVVATRRGIDCEFGECEAELVSADENVIQLRLRRAEHAGATIVNVTRAEFEEVAREVQ